MCKKLIFLVLLAVLLGPFGNASAAVITINSTEIWDGGQMHGITPYGSGTLSDPYLYYIPDGMTFTSTGVIKMNDKCVAFDFSSGTGGLEMAAGSYFDLTGSTRLSDPCECTILLGTHSLTGAGDFKTVDISKDSMDVVISGMNDVSVNSLYLRTDHAFAGSVTINVAGSVNIGSVDTHDQGVLGYDGGNVTIYGADITVGGIDTRSLSETTERSGNVWLEAWDYWGNNTLDNKVNLYGTIKTYTPVGTDGNITIKGVVVNLEPGFGVVRGNGGLHIFAGVEQYGRAAEDLLVDNSGGGYSATHDVLWSLLGTEVSFEMEESGDFETVGPAMLTVVLYNPPISQTVTVEYAVSGGTADGNGVDYTLDAGLLSLDAGDPNRTIEVNIVDDGAGEEDETIEVTLFNPVNADLGPEPQHTYTIIDPRPFVAFDAETSSGREHVSPAEIPVSLSWSWGDTVTVDYNATGGTAAGGEDYVLASGTLVFEPCEVTEYISVTVVLDEYDEDPDETIEITLSNPGNSKLGTNAQHIFTIQPPPVRICPEGDLDGDCAVDFNDLEVFVGQWLEQGDNCSDYNCADVDGINGVDMYDLALLIGSWGDEVWPVVINEFMASNGGAVEDPNDANESPDWFELYNASPMPIELGGMYLTDKLYNPTKWEIPAGVTIDAWGFLVFWADGKGISHGPTHTNFSLNAGDGEAIGLFDTDGSTMLCGIEFNPQTTDISYGSYPDASDDWRFFGIPTPGWENNGAYLDEVADTKFSHNRGFYDTPFNLSITCNTADAQIRYTLDGSEPNESGGGPTYTYTGPIEVNQTTTLRAAAFEPGYLPTNVDTHTYIFGADSARKALPTISLVSGELVNRTGPVSMELIYGDANMGEGFQADCESAAHSVNSYRIRFKAEFGNSQLRYPFFEAAPLYADSAVDRFDRLVLRIGSQFPTTWVAEPWTRLAQIAMSGPSHGGHSMYVHYYINGVYEGLINPVERPDGWFASSYFGGDFEDYFATNHNEDPPDDFLSGDPNRYLTLLAMGEAKNLEDPNNYEDFKGFCDVVQFADYVILYWYTDFEDGINNNYYAFMRNVPLEGSVPPEGLMYYMWDAEFAFRGEPEGPRIDERFFTRRNAPISIIFVALLENADFRFLLADRAYKHCFNDGALTDENAEARWDIIYDHIASGGVTPYLDDDYNGISGRRDVFISVLREWSDPCWPGIKLYPEFDPPIFNQQGGQVPSGFGLEMTDPCSVGDIYYTLDGSDPRQAVTGSAVGTLYASPVTLTGSKHVRARVFDDPNWSALNEAIFAIGPVVENLRVTEIMYHPQDTNDPNDPNTEYVELKNIGPNTLNLNLVSFTNGIDFTFGAVELAAGAYIVVVKDQNAFAARYPSFSGVIGGEYTGRLNNGGERIELEDAIGRTILNFRYEDNWQPITDGGGYSLTIIDPNNSDPNSWSEKDSWRPSAYVGGSPGSDDAGVVPNPGAVVINEVMAHSHLAPDWIELYNTTGSSIDLSGWFLSDSDSNVMKYEIAAGTTIASGQYLVFYEDVNFGDQNDPGCHIPFAFSENGEEV
ncbi:MAG: lamin tail domain-containing protein, partial [Planctomycetota bacterium]